MVYVAQARYGDAEPLFRRALDTSTKALGPSDPLVAICLQSLAGLFREQGRYAEAEESYKRALAINEKSLPAEDPEVARSLNNLGLLYAQLAKFADAEPVYLRALAIFEKVLGPTHPDVAVTLTNLAEIYRQRGQATDAERRYQQAVQIQERALGAFHPDLATSLTNLAELYRDQERSAEAEPLLRRALAIRERTLGPFHPDVANSLNNLASLYVASRNYPAAEAHLLRAVDILDRAFGSLHPGAAVELNNLGKIHEERREFPQAKSRYLDALNRLEVAWGKHHPQVWRVVLNLASLHHRSNRPIEAREYYERALESVIRQLEQEFSYLNEREQLEFIETVRGVFPLYFSLVLNFRDKDAALAGQMYDALLYQKGMVAAGIAGIRSKIAASGDTEATALFSSLTEKKRQLFRLMSAPSANGDMWRQQLAGIERDVSDLERQLTRRSSAFATLRPARASWQAVARRLRSNEAAIEFVKFPFYDHAEGPGRPMYAALVLTANAAAGPTLVPLGEARALECGPLNEYALRIAPFQRQGMPCLPLDRTSALALTPTFYESFWKPLEPALGSATRVFVSLDGILNQLSLAVVADDKGTLLLDKYDLRVVLTTRDLLRDPAPATAKSAVLIGNPLFTIDESLQVAAVRPYQTLRGDAASDSSGANGLSATGLRGPAWDPLPGTKQEVDRVARALRAQKWDVTVHEGKDAVVEAVKNVRSPRVLHVATHGEYSADPDETSATYSTSGLGSNRQPSILNDPMMRSGLFFTGANRYRAGLPPPAGADDGVLTAYEASQLNLNGTELVVLSACRTGLGQSRYGEGVFGLRRAFQVAGAESVMMTMWSVPDSDTQELMALFYQKWLAGADKHEALRYAQREIRKKTGDASAWGALVLVGR
jgi:CHAT domain-containing protein/tetratricopeptide (TPR) repeat protein